MASPIAHAWIYATVPIQNQWGDTGTGFLVGRQIDDKGGHIFLVTNKHIIHKDPLQRLSATNIQCGFNTQESDGSMSTLDVQIPLDLPDGTKRYREHPDRDTDVFAINVTDVFVNHAEIASRQVSYDMFADRKKLEELDITVGEDIVTLGYPLGMRQGETNFPLVRQGIIATRIGYPIREKLKNPDGTYRDRSLRAFLIDGATIHGSSGSPVILKPVSGRLVGDKINMQLAPPLLLGIVAETMYAPIPTKEGPTPGFADLGLAFEVDTIRETIELFFESPVANSN